MLAFRRSTADRRVRRRPGLSKRRRRGCHSVGRLTGDREINQPGGVFGCPRTLPARRACSVRAIPETCRTGEREHSSKGPSFYYSQEADLGPNPARLSTATSSETTKYSSPNR